MSAWPTTSTTFSKPPGWGSTRNYFRSARRSNPATGGVSGRPPSSLTRRSRRRFASTLTCLCPTPTAPVRRRTEGSDEVSEYATDRRHTLDFSAFMLIVANGRYYGSGFTVAPNAVMDDGLFNIRLFRNFSKRELLRHFWSISRRRYAYSPKIDTFTASEINITGGGRPALPCRRLSGRKAAAAAARPAARAEGRRVKPGPHVP